MSLIKYEFLGHESSKIISHMMKFEDDSPGQILKAGGGGPLSNQPILIIIKSRPPIFGVGFGPLYGVSQGPRYGGVLHLTSANL